MACHQSPPYISHRRMEMDRSHLTENLLNLTLEIIYLLTGERFPPVMPGDHLTIKVPPPHSLTMERNYEKKILEVTQKMIELLTGEVPIRCQDVSVYFSMEEWEYLEGHRDLYKDVMMENEPPLTSPDLLSTRPHPPISPSPSCLNRDPRNVLHSLSAPSSLAAQNTIHLLEVITKTTCEKEGELLSSDMARQAHHVQSTSTHVKEEPLPAEEHLPKSDISKTIQDASHIMSEQDSSKGHHPHPDLSILTYPTQGSSTLIKEEPLSAEEHLLKSDISKTIQDASHIMSEQVSSKGPHPDLSILTYPTQASSTLIKEEPLPVEEHLPKSDISKTIQDASHIMDEQVSSKDHHPHPDLSILTYPTQGSSTLIKEEPLPAEEHLPKSDISKTIDRIQDAGHIMSEKASSKGPHPVLSVLTYPTQGSSTLIKEEPLSAEEHLPKSDISKTIQDASHNMSEQVSSKGPHPDLSILTYPTQGSSTLIKEEPLPVEEHLPKSDISKTIQDASHIMDEQVSSKDHHPHPDLSILTYPTQGSSTLIKEEPLPAEEHLPKSDISKTIDRIQDAGHIMSEKVSSKGPHPVLSVLTYPTQGSATLIKEEPLSAEEHLPKSDISKTIDHIQDGGHIMSEQVSSKGHRPHPDLSILTYPTQGSSTLIKEEPLPAEEHLHLEVSEATGHAQSAPAHVKEESEHVPSSEISGPDHAQYHVADIKSESPSCGEEQLLNLKNSMSMKDAVRIKEEPLFGEDGGIAEGDTSELTGNGSVDNCNSDFHPPALELGHLKKNLYACLVCGKRLRSKAALLAHQGIHSEHKSYSCSECGKCFTRNSSLVSHWRFHTGEKPYACSMCGMQFITNSALAWHRRSHTDEKPFLCPDCGKSFFTNSSLKKHRKIHAVERPFSCSECGKGFTSNSDLIKHQRIHTGVRPYSCSQCDKCFITKSDLGKHQKVHTVEKLFPCPDCTMSFLTSHALLKHRKIHAADKPFSCSECRKRFTSSFDLDKHQKFHLEEKLHACSECGKRFSTKHGMVKHQRLHSGLRPFSCSDCGKCFMRSSDLARHRQSHRGVRPFQCPECLKCFTRKQTLLSHQKIHADGKLFSCSVCGKRFNSSLELEEHQKVHLD